jgi:restriction endonuclease Mrr
VEQVRIGYDKQAGGRRYARVALPETTRVHGNVAMRLRLIDGDELTKLMVRYNVGVQVRETFDLKEIDEDVFEE